MEYKDYLKQLGTKTVRPVLFLTGNEDYVKKSVIEKIKKAFVDESMIEFDMNIIDNQTLNYDALLSAVDAPAMFSERRMVVVNVNPDNVIFKDERLVPLISKSGDDIILVLNVAGKPDGRSAVVKKIEAVADCVCIDELDKADVLKWIMQKVKAAGKKIGNFEADYIISLVGDDLFQLQTEIAKLVDCTDEDEITKADIDKMIAHTPEHGVFALVDAVAAKKTADAVRQCKLLFDDGAEAFGLLALVERQYQLLYRYLSMVKEGEQQKTIMEKLALKPFIYDKIKKQASSYSIEKCKKALQMCIELDYDVKSGKADQKGGFELLVVKLCQN